MLTPQSAPSAGSSGPSGCARFPLLQQLRAILAKPSMESFTAAASPSTSSSGEATAISVSHAIYASPENEEMRRSCPWGVATAEIYLAVAQDKDWKYKLLHKGLYALLAPNNATGSEISAGWPVNVELVDTLYRNSETSAKMPILGDAAASTGGGERIPAVLFYHWYLGNACECTSRSWCQPFYLHEKSGNHYKYEIFLVARDSGKTIYKMDSRGCFRSLGYGLSDVYMEREFDKIFVFEINAFMDPEMRALRRKSEVLFPMYAYPETGAIGNRTVVISDHTYFKPPSPALTRTLTVAYRQAASRGRPRERRLVIPAAVWSPKQQVEFLKKIGNHLQQLDVKLLFLGECGTPGNLSYCHEFDRAVLKWPGRVQWLESVTDAELAAFYAQSLGIVLNSLNDCNPRVLYEALWTDTPFLVSSGVVVPEGIRKFGRVFQAADDNLVDVLELFLTEATSRRRWPVGELRAFAEEYVNEDAVYPELFKRANISIDASPLSLSDEL